MNIFSKTTVAIAAGNSQVFELPAVAPGTAQSLTALALVNLGGEDVYATTGATPGIAATTSGSMIPSGTTVTITPNAGDLYFALITAGSPSVVAAALGI